MTSSALRFALSALVTLGLSAWLLSGIDRSALVELVRRVDRPLLAVFVALSFAGLFVRAFRYRLLLRGRAGFWPLVGVTAARNFLVDLLPARVGSLSYVYLLTTRVGVPLEPVLSSFVLSFVYDLLAMSLLVGVALSLELGRFEGAGTLALLLAVFAVASVAVFVALAPAMRFGARLAARVPRLAAIRPRLEATAGEIEATGRGAHAVALVAISFVIRLLKFGAYWALLLAVLHERGFGATELPFWRVFLGIAAAELSATLPIHGIAGFGTYEAAWTIGFSHLGVDREIAVLSGFATHLLSQIYDYSLGLVALAILLAWRRRP